jgi:Protein of unknown function (DUF3309)
VEMAELLLCQYCASSIVGESCSSILGGNMPRALLLVIVVILLLGVLPTWPYSASWGYYPSGGLGLILLILLILVLAKKL